MAAFKFNAEVNLTWPKVMEVVLAMEAEWGIFQNLCLGQKGKQTGLVNKMQSMLEESQTQKGFFCSGRASSL